MPSFNNLHSGRHRVDPGSAVTRCDHFERISTWAVRAAGGRWGFSLAIILILAWGAAGVYFRYHESCMTTFTVIATSITFLLVFLIQNAHNRESKALHLKLDELIHAAKNARNELINIEHLTEEQLDHLGRRYSRLSEHYQRSRTPLAREAIPARAAARQIGDRDNHMPENH
jgi:low affinity Fe/Cu permease